MNFTYIDDLLTDRDKVRFNLHDTVLGKGPKPEEGTTDSTNFTDNEIAGLLTIEGTWQRAVAAGFEVLASAWAKFSSYGAPTQVSRQLSEVAKGYREQAKLWRTTYGGAGSAATAGGVSVIRQDGYSDDLTSVETAGLDGAEYS